MEGLGRLFNIVPTADAVEVSLKDARGVTFVCVQGGASAETFTVQEAQDAAGTGAQNLAVIEHSYNNANVDGSTAWTEVDELSSGSAVAAVSVAIGEVKAIYVSANSLSDGFGYVSCAGGASGLVYAIVHDLAVQRRADLLAALAV